MKKAFFFAITILATAFNQKSFAVSNPTNTNISSYAATKITLRAGTTVSFKLNEEVNSEDFYVNNALRFKVAVNVTVNGKVVIATNAYAEGTITKVKKAANGEVAELQIVLESVQAVDGTRIDLDPSPHIVRANQLLTPATANIGSLLRAHVLNDTQVKG
jgi:hypothetical protein